MNVFTAVTALAISLYADWALTLSLLVIVLVLLILAAVVS